MPSVYIMHFCVCGKCQVFETTENYFDEHCLGETYTFLAFIGNSVVLKDQGQSDSCSFCRKEIIRIEPTPDAMNA